MILGHYASALIPYSKFKRYPFWILLVCSNVPEFLWLLLALLGIEETKPASLLDATIQGLQVQMTYSHNLIPAALQGFAVGGIIFVFFKDRSFAFWCGFLTLFHVLCDFIVGFEHQLLGVDSISVGLNSYLKFPHLAIGIEFLFSLVCIFWFVHTEKNAGNPLSRKKIIYLLLVFSIGVLIWFPTATIPMKNLLPFKL
ncbi:MAG: hypothetical protein KBA66_06510 [Leptospiraceae bacterium]|nr:hypothetical protein [Leptospiraceae bacterium]